jgi:hypothetical protein
MRPTAATIVLCAALTACGLTVPLNTARMPMNSVGSPAMTLNEAISLPAYALRNPPYTHDRPAIAARAIAAEDWLAGQPLLTPDFGQYDPVNRVVWGQLRREVRASIGVPDQVPSQELMNRLLAAEAALNARDTAAARAVLVPPTFPLGPDGTLAALSNLPTYPHLDQAFYELSRHENAGGNHCFSPLAC